MKAETRDLGKRLLLDQCFFEVQEVKVADYERVGGILSKISEKACAKAAWYPAPENMWMSEADHAAVNQL